MPGTLEQTVKRCVFLFTVDALLWLLLWLFVLILGVPNTVSVVWLWCYRLLSWSILHHLALLIRVDESQFVLLARWVAALCLLFPTYETVKIWVPFTSHSCPIPDVGTVCLCAVSASMACLVWEWCFPDKPKSDSRKEKKQQEARALLMRVVRYSAPDYLHLAAAFTFLTLTALGKSGHQNSCADRPTHLMQKEKSLQ